MRPKTKSLTVGYAAALFVDSLRAKAEAGQRSWSYVRSVQQRMGWIFDALGEETRIDQIGEREIEAAVLFLARRPMAKRRKHQRTESKPLSITLVVHTIRQMRALLVWVHELDGCDWPKPKRFDKLFRIRTRDMETPQERARAAS